MKRLYKHWNINEEQVILNQISLSPNNIQKALKISAKILDRSLASVCNYWYKKMSKQKENTCFYIVSNNVVLTNRKITDDSSPFLRKIGFIIWNKIHKTFLK